MKIDSANLREAAATENQSTPTSIDSQELARNILQELVSESQQQTSFATTTQTAAPDTELLARIALDIEATVARIQHTLDAYTALTTARDRFVQNFRKITKPELFVLENHWQGSPESLADIQGIARDTEIEFQKLARKKAALDRTAVAILAEWAISPERQIARATGAIVAGDAPALVRAAAETAVLPSNFPSCQQLQASTTGYLAQMERSVDRAASLGHRLQQVAIGDTDLAADEFAALKTRIDSSSYDSGYCWQDTLTQACQALAREVKSPIEAPDILPSENEAPAAATRLLQTLYLQRLADISLASLDRARDLYGPEVIEVSLGNDARLLARDDERFSIETDAGTAVAFQHTDGSFTFAGLPWDLTDFLCTLSLSLANRSLDLNLQAERFQLVAETLEGSLKVPGAENLKDIAANVAALETAAESATMLVNTVKASIPASDLDEPRIAAAIDRHDAVARTAEDPLSDRPAEDVLRDAKLDRSEQSTGAALPEELELELEL